MSNKPIRRTQSELYALRNRVIQYYEDVANCNKKITGRHFISTENLTKRLIYDIIGRHEKAKREGWKGYRVGMRPTQLTPENFKKYEELYRMDPMISIAEASQILNMPRSTLTNLRKVFKEKLKNGTYESLFIKQPEEIAYRYPDPNHVASTSATVMETTSGAAEDESVGHFGNDEDDHHHFSDAEESEQKLAFVPEQKPSTMTMTKPARTPKEKLKKKSKKRKNAHHRCVACFESFEAAGESNKTTILTDNLNAIFVFKNLLDLPSEELVQIMKLSKWSDPKDWVSFCGGCRKLVEEVLDIHSKIKKLEERLAECKKTICETVKNTCTAYSRTICVNEKLFATKRVREMVRKRMKHKTSSSKNPFVEGDKQAQSLLPPALDSSKIDVNVKKEIELPVPDDDNDFIHEDSFSDAGEFESVEVSKATEEVQCPEPVTGANINMQMDSLNWHGNFNFHDTTHVAASATATITPSENAGTLETTEKRPIPMPTSTLGICDKCGKEMRPLLIPMHQLMDHGIVMEGYTLKKCNAEGCGYKTLYDVSFREHLKNHSARSYVCRYNCGKSFANKNKLSAHEEIHKNAETRPYVCDLCAASFAVRNYLYLHKRLKHEKRAFPSTKRKRLNIE